MSTIKLRSAAAPVVCAVFLLLSALPLAAQTGRNPKAMEGSVHRAAREGWDRPAHGLERMAKPSRRFSLRALSNDEMPVGRKPGLNPVGVDRQLPEDALAQGEWGVTPEGRPVWRLALTSPGAAMIRVRFADFHAGAGNLWVLGKDAQDKDVSVGPYTADGPFGDGEFWTDVVPGDSVIIAFEPADGAQTAVPLRPVEISHRFTPATAKKSALDLTPAAGDDIFAPQAAAASCTLDVSCYPQYSQPASAVALMIFESGGSSYECTGSLVTSASQPAQPFFMTANHCIANDTEARSLIAVFNYQTPTCDGSAPSFSSLPRVSGSTFVAGQAMELGDFTLLQLVRFPNVDVKVLGWISDDIASDQQVVGISHPRGDFKRISFGQRTRDVTIRFSDGARMPASRGYQVAWQDGVTQSGSSGSPLLVEVNGGQYLTGTLTAGPDIDENNTALVCRTSNRNASYGRFSAAYPYLQSFLTASSVSNNGAVSGTLTANPNPIALSAGQSGGRATLSWQAVNVARVQIRVGSPDGTPMTGLESPFGSASTGDWVSDGMMFYLQDASSGDSSGTSNTIASVRMQVSTPNTSGARQGSIVATPNPIRLQSGQSFGAATLTWRATGVTRVQVRVGSANGTAMTGFESPNGSAVTGNWVANGTTFYLQDASSGDSSGAARTLSIVTVRVQ